ncbi:GFA domain-containing protein [Mycena venus]|uniref:GFA domain-containing protein n=1 Tax=Mycena venus TaxID=2733690 RepID=A0A8H6Y5H4_9AGAR|nr:GFA domain-containing protein [Mycena venus]
MSRTPQLVEYRGNCHCGAFKFKLKVPEIKEAEACTCSMCYKNGYLWAFPKPDKCWEFTVVKGDENTTLKNYLFGKKMMAHKFCPSCGTSVMEVRMPHSTVVNAPSMAINIRTLEDVDFDSVKVNTFDGASILQPPYQIPEPVAAGPVPEGTTSYHGNCHCGAVAYTLLSGKKISEAASCNCSICWRDAALWIYPESKAVTFKGLESAVEYTFAKGGSHHGFCKICGVSVYERFVGTHQDNKSALNVRTMNDLDLAALEIEQLDGKSLLPAYDVWGTEE